MTNIVENLWDVPQGFPQPVGPTIVHETKRTMYDVYKALVALPVYAGITLPLKGASTLLRTSGNVMKTLTYGVFGGMNILDATHEKIVNIINNPSVVLSSGDHGHGDHGHSADAHADHGHTAA